MWAVGCLRPRARPPSPSPSRAARWPPPPPSWPWSGRPREGAARANPAAPAEDGNDGHGASKALRGPGLTVMGRNCRRAWTGREAAGEPVKGKMASTMGRRVGLTAVDGHVAKLWAGSRGIAAPKLNLPRKELWGRTVLRGKRGAHGRRLRLTNYALATGMARRICGREGGVKLLTIWSKD
jgi:hypothetical protein